MAALELKRSVRVVLTRQQMFTFGYRPDALQTRRARRRRRRRAPGGPARRGRRHLALRGLPGGRRQLVGPALRTATTSRSTYKLAQARHLHARRHARAGRRRPASSRSRCAMDELAYATGHRPARAAAAELRRDATRTRTSRSPRKELRACYAQGAERFGWRSATPEPRSMREGRELVGWGMATGIWEAHDAGRRARSADADAPTAGSRSATATADIGTGTYTILTQIAADALGLPIEDVTAQARRLVACRRRRSRAAPGRRPPPARPCMAACREVAGAAVQAWPASMEDSPLADVDVDDVDVRGRPHLGRGRSRAQRRASPRRCAPAGMDQIEAEEHGRARTSRRKNVFRPTRTRRLRRGAGRRGARRGPRHAGRRSRSRPARSSTRRPRAARSSAAW